MIKSAILATTLGVILGCAQDPGEPIEQKPATQKLRSAIPNPRYSEAISKREDPHLLFRLREADLDRATSDQERLHALPPLAKAALEIGLNEKAEAYANEALRLAETCAKSIGPAEQAPKRYGHEVYYAEIVLGRVALARGDTETAKRRLLLAGQTTPVGALATFGPNMSLARELLLVSQSEAVLEFLVECKRFLIVDVGRVERWSSEIRQGKVPDFGASLYW
jgi:hypothetical protein